MKTIGSIAFLATVALATSCSTLETLRPTAPVATTKTGSPTPFLVPEKENPDVIWFVRATDGKDSNGDTKTMYGLFACYRGPPAAPGAKCYMAQYSWKMEDLNWPGETQQAVAIVAAQPVATVAVQPVAVVAPQPIAAAPTQPVATVAAQPIAATVAQPVVNVATQVEPTAATAPADPPNCSKLTARQRDAAAKALDAAGNAKAAAATRARPLCTRAAP